MTLNQLLLIIEVHFRLRVDLAKQENDLNIISGILIALVFIKKQEINLLDKIIVASLALG